jgi:hypothetical protein
MSTTISAASAFRTVRKAAEKIKNDETQTIGTVSPGDVIRQGDLYLVAIGAAPEIDINGLAAERQLAPGASQGSRHILEGPATVFAPRKPQQIADICARLLPGVAVDAALVGPVLKTEGECELTHPEHGNFKLPADEYFAVVYQRAFADTIRRQLD